MTVKSKKLGRVMDFAVFEVNKKISEHASLTAAKKKARTNTAYRVRQWDTETKHWKEIGNN